MNHNERPPSCVKFKNGDRIRHKQKAWSKYTGTVLYFLIDSYHVIWDNGSHINSGWHDDELEFLIDGNDVMKDICSK